MHSIILMVLMATTGIWRGGHIFKTPFTRSIMYESCTSNNRYMYFELYLVFFTGIVNGTLLIKVSGRPFHLRSFRRFPKRFSLGGVRRGPLLGNGCGNSKYFFRYAWAVVFN